MYHGCNINNMFSQSSNDFSLFRFWLFGGVGEGVVSFFVSTYPQILSPLPYLNLIDFGLPASFYHFLYLKVIKSQTFVIRKDIFSPLLHNSYNYVAMPF